MAATAFTLGQTVITSNARATLVPADVTRAIARHAAGDWGDLDPHDVRENEFALTNGCRLFSAYSDGNGRRFYVITEADRSVTTVLLPEDY